ncbi:MAG TPA: S24/S26 family peptidase [Nitrospiraceae bacterium]|jgi:hypothetical protein|nr:S24/S26 family peptidase [Nitrospiraceae bacterium]
MIRRLILDHTAAFRSPADLRSLLASPLGIPLIQLRVASWSMFPTIHKGDVLEVEEAREVRPGDIVVFRRDNVLVCHRVTGYGGPGEIFTAGERSGGFGEAVPLSDVLAKVRAINRRGKRVALGRPATPTVAARLRLWLDRFFTAWKTARRRWAVAVWQRLHHSPCGCALQSWLVRHATRVHLITRSRLHSLLAIPAVHRETFRLAGIERTLLLRPTPAGEGVRLEVRLGSYVFGACDPAAGKICIQPLVKDLGLEQILYKLTRRLEAGLLPEEQPIEREPGLQPGVYPRSARGRSFG